MSEMITDSDGVLNKPKSAAGNRIVSNKSKGFHVKKFMCRVIIISFCRPYQSSCRCARLRWTSSAPGHSAHFPAATIRSSNYYEWPAQEISEQCCDELWKRASAVRKRRLALIGPTTLPAYADRFIYLACHGCRTSTIRCENDIPHAPALINRHGTA